MLARKVEFDLVLNKKDEFLRKFRDEVLPILRKQDGFIDILGLTNEIRVEKAIIISLWDTREQALKYEQTMFPKITDMLKPYMMSRFTVTPYMVETTVSEHILSPAVKPNNPSPGAATLGHFCALQTGSLSFFLKPVLDSRRSGCLN